MILDATTKSIEVILAGAVTTNQLPIVADWVDITTTTLLPGITAINTNGTTAVTAVGPPAALTQRKVNGISIYNQDTVAATVTVRFNNNATLYNISVCTLQVGERLDFTDTGGWRVLDNGGNIKTNGVGGNGRYLRTVVLTSGTIHKVGPNCNTIFLRMLGGGGGGGGASFLASNAAVGGGGSSGGYAEKTFAVTPNTNYTYAIGAAGAAGANTGGTGGTGGITTFAVGITVQANGGLGGVGQTYGTSLATVLGGASPAVSTNGDINSGGQPGEKGIRLSGTIAASGNGGGNPFGAGGGGRNTQNAGIAGLGYGSGGGGGCALSAAVTGGAGAAGVIVVDEFS